VTTQARLGAIGTKDGVSRACMYAEMYMADTQTNSL